MRHVIVVCGTYKEWINFMNWFFYENTITSFRILRTNGSFIVDDLVTYHGLVANDYNHFMGFDKMETKVSRIGTWYEHVNEDTERFLALFQWGCY